MTRSEGSTIDLGTLADRSLDPRAARTRQAIFDAVEQLKAEGAANVTVSDIVRVAGISRSSFYVHFASLDELAVGFLRREFSVIGAAAVELRRSGTHSNREAARIGYTRLVAHLISHDSLYTSALGLPLSRQAYDEAVAAYADQLLRSIVERSPVPPGVIAEAAATYVAGGALMLVSAWLRGSLPISDTELVDQLIDLLPSWLAD